MIYDKVQLYEWNVHSVSFVIRKNGINVAKWWETVTFRKSLQIKNLTNVIIIIINMSNLEYFEII